MGFDPIYPYATQLKKPLFTWGKFNDMPVGITLHYTADGSLQTAINSLRANNLAYHIIIDRDGSSHQCAPFTDRVYHAGKSVWLGYKPNSYHIAISLVSWGKLVKKDAHWESWRGDIIPDAVERFNGHWQPATENQEASLYELLKHLINSGIDPHHICGHDECALPPGRKIDPGGVLTYSMREIRARFSEASSLRA